MHYVSIWKTVYPNLKPADYSDKLLQHYNGRHVTFYEAQSDLEIIIYRYLAATPRSTGDSRATSYNNTEVVGKQTARARVVFVH